jgi:WD40 repeat protein
VKTCTFHPTVDGLLCSSSMDMTVRLFDVNAASEISCFHLDRALGTGARSVSSTSGTTSSSNTNAQASVINISFNYDGSLIAMACRDRSLRILDPRANQLVLSTPPVSSSSSSSSAKSAGSRETPSSLALGRNLRVEWCSSSSGSGGSGTVSRGNCFLSVCAASNGCRMMHSWDPRLVCPDKLQQNIRTFIF